MENSPIDDEITSENDDSHEYSPISTDSGIHNFQNDFHNNNFFDEIQNNKHGTKQFISSEEINDEINGNKNIYESLYFMPKWAIWYRCNFHIPRCSNHSEGVHGNINQTLIKHGIYSMKSVFSNFPVY